MTANAISPDQVDISIGSAPCDIESVPTLLENISSFRGRDDLGINRDARLDLLEQARQLVHALETPRELMLKHIGAEVRFNTFSKLVPVSNNSHRQLASSPLPWALTLVSSKPWPFIRVDPRKSRR